MNLTSEEEYNYLLKEFKTVFFGNFTGHPEKFIEYKNAAEHFNAAFMQLPENSNAFPFMNYSAPAIYVQDYHFERKLPVKYDPTSYTLNVWIQQQLQEHVTEITDANSNHAFKTPIGHMAILFAPKSLTNYTKLVKDFDRIVTPYKGKASL